MPESGDISKNESSVATTALPTAIYTTSFSLIDCVDKKLMVVLRDGRKLLGILRSFDQFANLVLQETIERIYMSDRNPPGYADMQRGLYIIRGENVVLIGEIDLDREEDEDGNMRQVITPEAWMISTAEKKRIQVENKIKSSVLFNEGFSQFEDSADAY